MKQGKSIGKFSVKPSPGMTGLIIGISVALCTNSVVADSEEALLQQLTTPAGHTFWHYPMPDADRTALSITWSQTVPTDGSVHPMVARIGIDVMLNGGAGGRGAAEIVADYQDLDSGSGLWVEATHVAGFIFSPDKHLSEASEIAKAVLTQPAFEERWFDREKQNILDAAKDDKTNAWGIAWNVIHSATLGEHKYNDFWSIAPIDDIEAITLSDAKKWHESSFSTKNSLITVAGSVSAESVAKEIDLLLEDMPSESAAQPASLKLPPVPGKTILLHQPDAPKSVVVLVGNLPPGTEENKMPIQLALGVLGYGQQSRLFKSVRAGLGASYGFGAGQFDLTRENLMLEMSGELETAQLQTALDEIQSAYTKFRDDGVGRIEFPIAKRIFKRETQKQLENPVNVAFTVRDAVQGGFKTAYVQSFPERVDDLKRGTLNSIIKSSFPAYENLLKVIVSPDDKAVEGACVITKTEDVKNCL